MLTLDSVALDYEALVLKVVVLAWALLALLTSFPGNMVEVKFTAVISEYLCQCVNKQWSLFF